MRWLCRRGMKELDVLLESFMAQEYDQLSEEETAVFGEILQSEDPDLHAYLTGKLQASNPEWSPILERIRRQAGIQA